LRKKYFACLVAAALLLFALAMPAFAEPDEIETATDPLAVTEDRTAAPGFSIEPRLDGEDGELTEEQTFIAIMPYSEPATTIGFEPIDAELLAGGEEGEGLLSQRNLTFGALGLGGLALLLSVIALARTRKKTAPNATGNYQKYF